MTSKELGKLYFENRACEEAKYPRLRMKCPETFIHTEIQNFETVEKQIHLEIGYHHGRSQFLGTDKWFLDIDTFKGKRCYGETKLFNSIPEIKNFIQQEYKKDPIFPNGIIRERN